MRTTRAILTLADNVENLTYQGGGNFQGTGNALNNTLTGGAFNDTLNAGAGDDFVNGGSGNDNLIGGDGNDSLNGGGGNDTMTGGLGDDIYYLGDAGDLVIEHAGQGLDEVRTTRANVTLADNVERLTYQGGGNFVGTGNALANVITGGAFNDILNGGLGNDTLIGGSGADNFLFNTALNALTNSDSISGFAVADDTIMLENAIFTSLAANGILAAGNFTVGTGAADANDFIIYDGATGALYYDADGIGGSGQIKFAQLASGLALTSNDFLVI
jgi:Ca2+-binding RTX toxin-like protein